MARAKRARAVEVPDEPVDVYPETALIRDTARALLAAAEMLGHPPEVVESVSFGFRVPPDVAAATVWPIHPSYTGRSVGPTPREAVALGATPSRPAQTDADS